MTDVDNARMEVERGLRLRIAPQGITGTNYLEMDYIDPPPPVLQISWTPTNVYIPSAPSTVTTFVNAAQEILDQLRNLDVDATVANLNRLMITTNDRIAAIDTKGLSERADRALAKIETTLDGVQGKKISDEATALLAELRQTNTDLRKTLANPVLQKLPEDAAAAIASVKTLVSDPKLAKSVAELERIMGRFDRLFGRSDTDLATTIENLRQITDNLRDLTEETKRYPANVIFGSPPPPLERKP